MTFDSVNAYREEVFESRTPTHFAKTASTSRQVTFDSGSSPAIAPMTSGKSSK
jgi:hypothetical protein